MTRLTEECRGDWGPGGGMSAPPQWGFIWNAWLVGCAQNHGGSWTPAGGPRTPVILENPLDVVHIHIYIYTHACNVALVLLTYGDCLRFIYGMVHVYWRQATHLTVQPVRSSYQGSVTSPSLHARQFTSIHLLCVGRLSGGSTMNPLTIYTI